MVFFEITKRAKRGRARAGKITTTHGVIETPAFIPVGTQASVKGITPDQLKAIGVQAVLANTYHLYLRPGDEAVKKMGGLHSFMNWNGPTVTDSGGFQAFSLGYALEHGVGKLGFFPGEAKDSGEGEHVVRFKKEKLTRITEDGVEFRSHLDGAKHFFTPEKSIQIQHNLGADIIFAFDECTSPLHNKQYTKESLERTHRWAVRSLAAHEKRNTKKLPNAPQYLFGILQGGAYKDLREKSAKFIGGMDFPGFGIGGSLGKFKKDMYTILDWVMPFLPEEKPRHLLGIGSADDIVEAVKRGIDTFDCVIPTRFGRNGAALTEGATINMRNSAHLTDKKPIDAACGCPTCQQFSRGYITHLFRAHEMLGPILLTIHNLFFMERFMKKIREAI